MERNWYLICTKNNQEKRVTELLTKKGIENFCPFTFKENKIGNTKRESIYGPLFNGYVFVQISQEQMPIVKKTPYIINFVYWKSKPAIVSPQEINAIRIMSENFESLKIEKTFVDTLDKFDCVEESVTSLENRVLTVKYKNIAAILPSIGFRISAPRDSIKPKSPKKEPQTVNLILQKLNPLFLFGF